MPLAARLPLPASASEHRGHLDLLTAALSRLDSVRKLAGQFQGPYEKIDVLVSNAGVSKVSRVVGADGMERWSPRISQDPPPDQHADGSPTQCASPASFNGRQAHNVEAAERRLLPSTRPSAGGKRVTANCVSPGFVNNHTPH